MSPRNHYFTHKCSEVTTENLGKTVVIAGWVANKRDHGSLLFIDIRDSTGSMQCILDESAAAFAACDDVSIESVVKVTGVVHRRPLDTVNPDLVSGEIELRVSELEVLSEADPLPFALHQQDVGEDMRLKYRFIDLRRAEMQERLKLRFEVIKLLRNEMERHGFMEVQTPLLTASSPEGARDYVVPSRLHKGKFYVLPQAPQQFKQLLMVSGVDRYYQVAPCFRDEDTRADRAPGAFYQLDLEMAFATQEDVLNVVESVLFKTFRELSNFKINQTPFPRISYKDAMRRYATDKPDLRNPLEFIDIFEHISANPPEIFKSTIQKGGKIYMLPCEELSHMPRSFFDQMGLFAQSLGAKGLGYVIKLSDGLFKGPLASILPNSVKNLIESDGAFVIAHEDESEFYKIASALRDRIAQELDLIEKNSYRFCWIVDFPMYEMCDDGRWDFSHNPFSMPQGGMDALNGNPGDIVAWQYDIVCNGYELSSGAVRNHKPEIMYRAFEIAGYSKNEVDQKFGAMINAFRYGAPPHAGCAPGIDRIVMLLAGVKNLREVIPFPLTQSGVDLMMNAPSELSQMQLRELGLQVIEKKSTA